MVLAVVRVRGGFKINKRFENTFRLLRLNKKHHCVLLEDNAINKGMLNKVREWVTWGEVSEPVLKSLLIKRSRVPGGKKLELTEAKLDSLVKKLMKGVKLKDEGINPVFRLSPPKGGWERGTTKLQYPRGALGPRKSIDSLLKKMI